MSPIRVVAVGAKTESSCSPQTCKPICIAYRHRIAARCRYAIQIGLHVWGEHDDSVFAPTATTRIGDIADDLPNPTLGRNSFELSVRTEGEGFSVRRPKHGTRTLGAR